MISSYGKFEFPKYDFEKFNHKNFAGTCVCCGYRDKDECKEDQNKIKYIFDKLLTTCDNFKNEFPLLRNMPIKEPCVNSQLKPYTKIQANSMIIFNRIAVYLLKFGFVKIIQHYPKHLSWIGLRPFKLIPFSYKPETDAEFRRRNKLSENFNH